MELFIILCLAGAVIYFLVKPSKPRPNGSGQTIPIPRQEKPAIFQKRDYFFRSAREKALFNKLKKAIDQEKYAVFPQVRLADLVRTPQGNPEYDQAYLKTLPYQVDFVICNCPEYKVCLAIELDSPHHATVKQMERDLFKSKVLEQAGIPLLRFRVEENFTLVDIQNRIQPYLAVN